MASRRHNAATRLIERQAAMLPPRMRLDPEGHYARLGLRVDAAPADITAAYRRKARELHPDVPVTGDTGAFVLVKAAYDVLSSVQRREAYDRAARRAVLEESEPGEIRPSRPVEIVAPHTRQPRWSDLPWAVWAGVVLVLFVGIWQVTVHLTATPVPRSAGIRPNAPSLPSNALPAVQPYGAPPVRLAGTPTHYVVPAAGPTMLWRHDAERNAFVPNGQLPPFSAVQALRLNRQNGLVEVRVSEAATGFVEAGRLTPGNVLAARRGYCAYNAGPAPANGEVLSRRGDGPGRLDLDNHTTQPAAVKLRDSVGNTVVTVYLAPGEHAEVSDLPDVPYQIDFALGELWSRACQNFAAGTWARRLSGPFSLGALTPLSIPPDLPGEKPPVDITDQAFERQ